MTDYLVKVRETSGRYAGQWWTIAGEAPTSIRDAALLVAFEMPDYPCNVQVIEIDPDEGRCRDVTRKVLVAYVEWLWEHRDFQTFEERAREFEAYWPDDIKEAHDEERDRRDRMELRWANV
jgi:hypothetical protein